MTDKERLELIRKRISMPVPNYLKEDFDWLFKYAVALENELNGHIDDIAQLEGMLLQANQRISELEKRNKMWEVAYANTEIKSVNKPSYMDLDD